jgi:hypothetical protein
MAMNPQNPADLLAAYRAAFGAQQPAAPQPQMPVAPGAPASNTAPALAQLAAALQMAKSKEPSRHIRNMEPGKKDHGSVSSAGHNEPPYWVHE